ncbi:MAG: hypothetical protein JWO53_821, partial [Chlamydiia bacterium]|nr:hypothetical protein [Chlamydiia bacterium]
QMGLAAKSLEHLQGHLECIVAPLRREVGQHIRHIQAIRVKVEAHIARNSPWWISIPIIGLLFSFVIGRVGAKIGRKFSRLSRVLEDKYRSLWMLESKLNAGCHLLSLIAKDEIIKKAFKADVVGKVEAEKKLFDTKLEMRKRAMELKTIFLLRRDAMQPDALILSKLDKEEHTKVDHISIICQQKANNQFRYFRFKNPKNPSLGKIEFDTTAELKTYLKNLCTVNRSSGTS